MENKKFEGNLIFDVNSGKFWITERDTTYPLTSLEFGDTFEVKLDDKWVQTSLEIINDDAGNLVFRLKGTNCYGVLDGLEVRV